MAETPIIYSGFYDYPLAFVVSHEGRQYLFWRGWDDKLDDYDVDYRVSLLPKQAVDDIQASWLTLRERAVSSAGTISVREVAFDPTHRAWIDTSTFDRIRPHNCA